MRRVITLVLILAFSLLADAQIQKDSVCRHFIVALDAAYSDQSMKTFIPKTRTIERIVELLKVNGFNSNDFLSVVSYSLNLSNPDFSAFITILSDSTNKPIRWQQYDDEFSMKLAIGCIAFNDIFENRYGRDNLQKLGSMQSLAKQYVLKTLVADNPGEICTETLLLMVTDEVVNGVDNNYVNEYDNVSCYNRFAFEKHRNAVFSFAKDCDANFQFVRTKLKPVEGFSSSGLRESPTDELRFDDKSNLKVVPYLVCPVVRPAIQSITDIPSPLPIRIVKGGYKLDLDAHVLSDKFEISSLTLLLPDGSRQDINNKELFIKRNKLSDGDSIILEMKVKYIDGFYNGIELSPKLPIYRQGLTLRTKFKLQQDAKIFGFIPLEDSFWCFFPEDAQMAVITWSVIIILIFIAIVCFVAFRIFRSITRYIPNNNDISILKI